ncbi:unnamed protein product [Chondrus crispus]|uniref:Uncharacterized protein n=1 Tax=Chondrus crispus TaxID=2769 RepID=R7QM22_CHOCR|nr:unnamed protein product [Chondrus crispus]CDF38440.1 unnamed protein product [Chondrus crispus]|eukprot:XP_005718333.1 unnamed protein product [Chondrus crispus]
MINSPRATRKLFVDGSIMSLVNDDARGVEGCS